MCICLHATHQYGCDVLRPDSADPRETADRCPTAAISCPHAAVPAPASYKHKHMHSKCLYLIEDNNIWFYDIWEITESKRLINLKYTIKHKYYGLVILSDMVLDMGDASESDLFSQTVCTINCNLSNQICASRHIQLICISCFDHIFDADFKTDAGKMKMHHLNLHIRTCWVTVQNSHKKNSTLGFVWILLAFQSLILMLLLCVVLKEKFTCRT